MKTLVYCAERKKVQFHVCTYTVLPTLRIFAYFAHFEPLLRTTHSLLMLLYNFTQDLFFPSYTPLTPAILPQNCIRNDLRRPEIRNFPGGAYPQTPLAARLARYRTISVLL